MNQTLPLDKDTHSHLWYPFIFGLLRDRLFNDLTREMSFLVGSSLSFVELLLSAGHYGYGGEHDRCNSCPHKT